MQQIGWYARRLLAMSPRELVFRFGRFVSLRLERISLFRPSVPAFDLSCLNRNPITVPKVDTVLLQHRCAKILDNRIDVFAISDYTIGSIPNWNVDPKTGRSVRLSFGKSIDYRDFDEVGDIKYLWEPSRHLMLPLLAQAYSVTRDRRYIARLVQLLDSWLQQCPFPYGPHWSSSLEAAIRLINWSYAWRFVGDYRVWCDLAPDDHFVHRWLSSVFRHISFIDGYYSGYSSANNHRIGEAAGVFIGATTWPIWNGIQRIRDRSRNILIEESARQNYPDGVNAEQAISYQQFVLDFLILAGIQTPRDSESFPQQYWRNIERMLEFIHSIMDSNGNMPMIGDSDDGYVLDFAVSPDFSNYQSLLATGAILFGRSDFAGKAGFLDEKTRWLLEDADVQFRDIVSGYDISMAPRKSFPSGGYYVLGRDLEQAGEIRIVFDAGPLGLGTLAAHGHADALAFTVSVGGLPMLVDPGTYAYHTDPKWRNYFRGTSAHNTARIDHLDQSEIAGNFLWRNHARTTVINSAYEADIESVDAVHDGYARLHDPVLHRRKISFDKSSGQLTIDDHFECKGHHTIELFFHFAEYVELILNGRSALARTNEHQFELSLDPKSRPRMIIGEEDPPLGWISYRFDSKTPAPVLVCEAEILGSSSLTTRIAMT